MREHTERFMGSFFQGWKEPVILFFLLLLAAFILSWLANRRLRPVDRGPALSVPMFVSSFGLLMIAGHFHHDRWSAVIIAVGLAVAGIIVSKSGTRAPVLAMIMLAVLLGFGLHLSALMLFIAAFVTLLLSRPAAK
jgi:hypothetical protein